MINGNDLVTIIAALLPAIVAVVGGQAILIRYRKSKEQEVELIRAVRERQYEAIQSLYTLFGQYMALYRDMNRSDLMDLVVREEIMKRAIQSEAEVEALLLKIACEFAEEPVKRLEYFLGHLRHSVQYWRKQLAEGKKLEFTGSNAPDYVKFKETFAETAAFMVHHIHSKLQPGTMRQEQVADLLIGIFDNKYERHSLDPLAKWQRRYQEQ
jgi:hypothetical protein